MACPALDIFNKWLNINCFYKVLWGIQGTKTWIQGQQGGIIWQIQLSFTALKSPFVAAILGLHWQPDRSVFLGLLTLLLYFMLLQHVESVWRASAVFCFPSPLEIVQLHSKTFFGWTGFQLHKGCDLVGGTQTGFHASHWINSTHMSGYITRRRETHFPAASFLVLGLIFWLRACSFNL